MKVILLTIILTIGLACTAAGQSIVRFFLYNPATSTGLSGVEIVLVGPDSLITACSTNSMGIGQTVLAPGTYVVIAHTADRGFFVYPASFTLHEDDNLTLYLKLERQIPFGTDRLHWETHVYGAEQNGMKDHPEISIVRAVTRKLADERALLDSLKVLPTLLPGQPGQYTIPAEKKIDSLFDSDKIVTLNELRRLLLAAFDSCQLPYKLGYYRCGDGLAVVAYPQGIANVTPGPYKVVGKVPGARYPTWRDVLDFRPDGKMDRERGIVFIFSNSSMTLGGKGDEWEQHRLPVNGYDGAYGFDVATGMHYPRRSVTCQIFVYDFGAGKATDARVYLEQSGLLERLKGKY
jgi:hypothetical protein